MNISDVILVDEHDNEIGQMEKMEAHLKGLLHRAFSVFVFDNQGRMLLQRRALEKYHSPGLWTNTCCSHPAPGESNLAAATRRLKEEMGFTCELKEIGAFTYRTTFDNGLQEYEFDHLFTGEFNSSFETNPEEVDSYKWLSIEEIDKLLKASPDDYTVWFKIAFPIVKSYLYQ
ncbi:isopentenyl-diphosphate Delta-isomerase [Desertivirga arenae]|uniref:isopentenyl-diphosphate Delta-isomerase n=1 Tax=Desertivirga arenae TaxID=2810309 RepID=UPI001A969010|nr:isopentenyl-diphosphate Delta-isomerase [Pedobacter sp. SYSU D00823]